jgi:predicted DCC family thiol-disulfide oxidoreductase YuxK
VVDLVFFDGHCGLCHRGVLFALRRDDGSRFAFAPLQGETFLQNLPASSREGLPDSLLILHGEHLLVKADAVLHLLQRLGGPWKLVAGLAFLFPRRMRDWIYDGVARNRHRWFQPPAQSCPRVPPSLQARFLP